MGENGKTWRWAPVAILTAVTLALAVVVPPAGLALGVTLLVIWGIFGGWAVVDVYRSSRSRGLGRAKALIRAIRTSVEGGLQHGP